MNEKPFRLALKALIRNSEGQCLLLRRSAKNKGFIGCWEWPGGKADPGEAFDEALRREVREETGLEIELLHTIGAFDFEMASARIVTLCMEAKPIGGTLRLSEEHDEYAWVPLEEVLSRDLVPNLKGTAAAYAASIENKGVVHT